jgi:hypothetical protein
MVKVVPRPFSLSALIVPPWASTIHPIDALRTAG